MSNPGGHDAHGKKGHGHGGDHDDHGHGGGGHEEGHEGAPEWLISFADNVALMMGFFVILLAMNMAPKGSASAAAPSDEPPSKKPSGSPDMIDAVIAIREAFNNPVNVSQPRPEDAELVQRLIERGKLLDVLDHAPKGKDREVNSIRPSDYHKLAAAVLFADRNAAIRPDAQRTIQDVANYLRGMRNIVEVIGHTSAAESSESPERAVKLSFDRAMAVATELAKHGLDWGQLRIIAVGDKDRLVERAYSADEQSTNQRVEIILTEKLYKN
jgi:flagellar motor protein MotB